MFAIGNLQPVLDARPIQDARYQVRVPFSLIERESNSLNGALIFG
jgi:hypothetical protein